MSKWSRDGKTARIRLVCPICGGPHKYEDHDVVDHAKRLRDDLVAREILVPVDDAKAE